MTTIGVVISFFKDASEQWRGVRKSSGVHIATVRCHWSENSSSLLTTEACSLAYKDEVVIYYNAR